MLLLGGCSTTPDSQTPVEWQQHQHKLAELKHYLVTGKIGYLSPQQRESFNFQWRRSDQNSQLRLTTFLGQTILSLSISPQGAIVETYDDRTLSGANADELIHQLTGLNLPVAALQNWLVGNPIQADHYQFNATHTLAALQTKINDQVWQLDYLHYRDETFGKTLLPLPTQLKLQQQDTTLNIVISKWVLNP